MKANLGNTIEETVAESTIYIIILYRYLIRNNLFTGSGIMYTVSYYMYDTTKVRVQSCGAYFPPARRSIGTITSGLCLAAAHKLERPIFCRIRHSIYKYRFCYLLLSSLDLVSHRPTGQLHLRKKIGASAPRAEVHTPTFAHARVAYARRKSVVCVHIIILHTIQAIQNCCPIHYYYCLF